MIKLKVDPSHPLAKDMFDCILWNTGGNPQNLSVQQGGDLTQVNSPTTQMTVEGPAGYVTGGSYYNSPDHGNMASGDLTARFRFIAVTAPAGTYTTIVDKVGGTREFAVFVNTTRQTQYIEIGGNNHDAIGGSGSFPLGQPFDFVITRVQSTGIVNVYWDGIFNVSTSGISGTTASPGAMSFGHDTSGNTDGDFKFLAFNLWKRVLSTDEIQSLSADPYGFLIPDEGEWPAINTVAAAAATNKFTNLLLMGVG